jgi:N-acetylglucosamine kinase-like BadF-type ATPase
MHGDRSRHPSVAASLAHVVVEFDGDGAEDGAFGTDELVVVALGSAAVGVPSGMGSPPLGVSVKPAVLPPL